MALSDVKVRLSLQKPTVFINMGNPLIITTKSGSLTYKKYKGLDAIKEDFPTGTVYEMAATIYRQEFPPEEISIMCFDDMDQGVMEAIEALGVFEEDWYFLLTTLDKKEDILAIAQFIEDQQMKQFHIQTSDKSLLADLKSKAFEHTKPFYHTYENEYAAAGLIGEVGSLPVGSATWKFRTIKGITPIKVNSTELAEIHELGACCYVTKAGIPQTSEGLQSSGEYTDTVHCKDWIISNIQNSVQILFSKKKKVSFDNRGIGSIANEVNNVLIRADRQEMIAHDEDDMPLYTVTTLNRNEVYPEDRAKRSYKGLKFRFELAGAIHDAEIVGEIVE